jgi:hypothetical protein
MNPAKQAQAMHNLLDQDYSWQAGSQLHQLVGPMINPAPSQGQLFVLITQLAPA